MQRPQARGTDEAPGDWAYVGDVEDPVFSPVRWYAALLKHWNARPSRRDNSEPFFLAKDGVRAYTYSAAMSEMKTIGFRDDLEYCAEPVQLSAVKLYTMSCTMYSCTVARRKTKRSPRRSGIRSASHDKCDKALHTPSLHVSAFR